MEEIRSWLKGIEVISVGNGDRGWSCVAQRWVALMCTGADLAGLGRVTVESKSLCCFLFV